MKYQIIQPPFTLKFREMPETELGDYFRWFVSVIPERVDELANTVSQTPAYMMWRPDFTPDSLDALGEWFATQVETRKRSEKEIEDIRNSVPYPFDFSENELTNRTFSLAIDVGIYLSQVFLQNQPSLRWNQEFGNKRDVDYGQPVLIDFGAAPFNPVRMMVTQSYGLVDGTKTGKDLRRLYELWSKMIPGTYPSPTKM
jgi:hypothetical protein